MGWQSEALDHSLLLLENGIALFKKVLYGTKGRIRAALEPEVFACNVLVAPLQVVARGIPSPGQCD